MTLYDLIINAIIGFLLGIVLILLYYIVKTKFSFKQEQESGLQTDIHFDIADIARLYESWIIDESDINTTPALLEILGLAKHIGNIIIANEQKIKEFLIETTRIIEMDLPPLISLNEKYKERMARKGIISITFLGIDSEHGPTFLFTTTPTRFTRRLHSDQELLNNIFFMAGRVDEVNIEGSRIIIKEISGGERGVAGYIIVEISRVADTDKIRSIIENIDRIPSDNDEAKSLLEKAL